MSRELLDGPLVAVSCKIERRASEQLTRLARAAGLSRSAYLRYLVLKETHTDRQASPVDGPSSLWLALTVSERLLAAVPPPVLDEAFAFMKRDAARLEAQQTEETSP